MRRANSGCGQCIRMSVKMVISVSRPRLPTARKRSGRGSLAAKCRSLSGRAEEESARLSCPPHAIMLTVILFRPISPSRIRVLYAPACARRLPLYPSQDLLNRGFIGPPEISPFDLRLSKLQGLSLQLRGDRATAMLVGGIIQFERRPILGSTPRQIPLAQAASSYGRGFAATPRPLAQVFKSGHAIPIYRPSPVGAIGEPECATSAFVRCSRSAPLQRRLR